MGIAAVFVCVLIECVGENAIAIKNFGVFGKKTKQQTRKKYVQVMNVLFSLASRLN